MTIEWRSRFERHHDRHDLAGEHNFGDIGQIIFLVIFLVVWLVDTFFIRYATFLSAYVPFPVRISLAVVILGSSWCLAKSGLSRIFGRVREEPVVVREGAFRLVRHPIYLGVILFYFGMVVISFSLVAAAVWVGAVAFYVFISRHEEKLLLEKFGREYKDYMREVPMLIPRLRK